MPNSILDFENLFSDFQEILSRNGLKLYNRILSVYGFSRTVVPHLLQANSRFTPLRAHHKLLLVAPTFARVFIIIR